MPRFYTRKILTQQDNARLPRPGCPHHRESSCGLPHLFHDLYLSWLTSCLPSQYHHTSSHPGWFPQVISLARHPCNASYFSDVTRISPQEDRDHDLVVLKQTASRVTRRGKSVLVFRPTIIPVGGSGRRKRERENLVAILGHTMGYNASMFHKFQINWFSLPS